MIFYGYSVLASTAKISNALRIEAAAGEPPFLPSIEICGTSNLARACLDSITETKPTGTPITNPGVAVESDSCRQSAKSAVGALPMT